MKINISKKNLKKKINVGRKNSEKKIYRPKLSKHDIYSQYSYFLWGRFLFS